ncbi:N-lysine methyltransferase KMT5A-A [Anabarilius grahami]|uniref:N-lysine methyltransferase KMT5A-A n=1 Tax=Anabarilius grahami TaxID=495550 RepID=A0A3N0XXS2_ANAGA|nr:N-lysine methyltransferase KMT5A-A [Anabarilius grahami]
MNVEDPTIPEDSLSNSIDASKEDGSLGRLCNDNHKSPNCSMKKIIVNNKPHLCLFAVKRIEIGSEIEYNYGDAQWPWRNKGPKKQASALETDASLTDHPSHDDPKMHDEITQMFTEGFGLVNYSESDETDDDKDNPTSPPSCFVRQKTRNENIQMDGVPDYSDPLFDSSESIVDETDEESSSQSDKVVPKRRTESISVCK